MKLLSRLGKALGAVLILSFSATAEYQIVGVKEVAKDGYTFKGLSNPDHVSQEFAACTSLEAAKIMTEGRRKQIDGCQNFYISHFLSCETLYVGRRAHVFLAKAIHRQGGLPKTHYFVTRDLHILGNNYSARCLPKLIE